MKITEPAADLAVCAAIVSAAKNITHEQPTVFFGEVGLGGEVRRVTFTEKRMQESKRLGMQHVMGPKEIKLISTLTT